MTSAQSSSHRRHAGHVPVPGRAHDLSADNAALEEGRSIFKAVPVDASPRLLVSGDNNRKIGKTVLKGRWNGFPVYTLTLEERATCPRSCALWAGCYGNAMPFARRHEAGALLEDTLIIEIMQAAARHPNGYVVRLHVLGDFYSAEYVELWGQLLHRFEPLNVYGYTAYHPDAEDPEEARIGQAIANVRAEFGARFAIRWSGRETVVVDTAEDAEDDVLICPAEQSEKASCGSCAFCWERDDRIGFIKHGMVRRGQGGRKTRAPGPRTTRQSKKEKVFETKWGSTFRRRNGISLKDVGLENV